MNVLNTLRISALSVFETFLNIAVSLGCTFVIFHSYKPTGNIKRYIGLIAATLAGKKAS